MTVIKPLLFGLGLFALAGCDSAEQAAANFAEKVEQAAVEQVKESLSETLKGLDEQVEQLNDKVDQAQEGTREWLDRQQAEPQEQQPQEEDAEQKRLIEA